MIHVKQWSNFEVDLKQPNMVIIIMTVPGIFCEILCKINEMIKCVPMLIFRIIWDFLILYFYSLFHIVNLVAL